MTATDTIFTALVLVLSISFVFMIAQIGMNDINPQNSSSIFNCSNSLLSNTLKGGSCTNGTGFYLNTEVGDQLPDQTTGTTGSNDPFTDTFTSAKNWLTSKLGIDYLFAFLATPYAILTKIGLPSVIAGGVAAIFYLSLLFLFASWIMGR